VAGDDGVGRVGADDEWSAEGASVGGLYLSMVVVDLKFTDRSVGFNIDDGCSAAKESGIELPSAYEVKDRLGLLVSNASAVRRFEMDARDGVDRNFTGLKKLAHIGKAIEQARREATTARFFARTASSADLQLFPLLKEKSMKTLKVVLLLAVLAFAVAGPAKAAQAGCCPSADCCSSCSGCK